MLTDDQNATLARDGAVWLRIALTPQALQALDAIAISGQRPGNRLSMDTALQHALRPVDDLIGNDMKPVRTVAFNKTEARNWALPWHQDRVIAVAEKHDCPGYAHWSQKAGCWHCEPPVETLTDMLFVRVQLDDTDADNGAMEVALGSHKAGFVAARDAETIASQHANHICAGQRGDVLILRMLILHRSLASDTPTQRRVAGGLCQQAPAHAACLGKLRSASPQTGLTGQRNPPICPELNSWPCACGVSPVSLHHPPTRRIACKK